MAIFSYRRVRALVTASVIWGPALLAAQRAPNRAALVELREDIPVPKETASLASLPAAPSAIAGESNSLRSDGTAVIVSMPIVATPMRPSESSVHRFWDRQNFVLFAATAGMATADFFVTHSNLQSGGRELNPVTRVFSGSTPALAANFALETGGVIGLSYIFHKTGHHRLERIASMVNISASAGAVAYGLSQR